MRDAWSKISPEVLDNLYKSKSGCFQTILDSKGAYAITTIKCFLIYICYCFKGTGLLIHPIIRLLKFFVCDAESIELIRIEFGGNK